MSDTAIQVRGLGKRYALGGSRKPYKTLRESVVDAVRAPFQKRNDAPEADRSFWALKDVNFTVNRGEVVGIIGRNGAGKSTLLKILSRITEPTEGEIDITGRVGSLLEVGTGFHPELTGRENIYLNGAILGMRRGEIQDKFDEIVAFAETEKFLDTPVKYYSSGMYMRLAFAVAAHLEPEILIVDEVLAVGDAQFQKKCLGKMSEVASQGRTILFVSHNLSAVQTLCNTSVWMAGGRVMMTGGTEAVVGEYQRQANSAVTADLDHRTDRTGTGQARCKAVVIRDEDLKAVASVPPGTPFYIDLLVKPAAAFSNVMVAVGIDTLDGTRIITLYSNFENVTFELEPKDVVLRCRVEGLPIRPDIYLITTFLGDLHTAFDHLIGAAQLEISDNPFYSSGRYPDRSQGAMVVHHNWTKVEP